MDFGDIDGYPRRSQVADFLAARTPARMNAQRWQEFIGLRAGKRVIDIGCGTGAAAAYFAAIVGPGGHVIGIDKSAHLLDRARSLYPASPSLRWQQGDAAALPFPAQAFDVAWIDRVLSHLDPAAAALREALRVLVPGGWLFVSEYDYAGIAWEGADVPVIHEALAAYRSSMRQPDAAQTLPATLRALGAARVIVEHEQMQLTSLREGSIALAWTHWLRQQRGLAPRGADVPALRRAARQGNFALRVPWITCLARAP